MRTTFLPLVTLAALGAALVLTHASAQSPVISIGSLTLRVGEQGSVELRALNIPEPGESAWEIEIDYDLGVVSVVNCAVTDESVCDAESADGSIRVTGVSISGFVGDATLAAITFRCESEGESSLSLTVIVFGEAIGFPPTPEAHNGSIACQEPRWFDGDANCDGRINSLDALAVLQFSAGILDALPFPAGGDPNGDGSTNSRDAQLILQFDAGLMPDRTPNACITIPPGPGPS